MRALLPIVGAAMALTVLPPSAGAAAVTPPTVPAGGEIRVALPTPARSTGGLTARIRVAGTTTAEKPTRSTHRYVWLHVDLPGAGAAAAVGPDGLIDAQLTLVSKGHRLLSTAFEVRPNSASPATPATTGAAAASPSAAVGPPPGTPQGAAAPTVAAGAATAATPETDGADEMPIEVEAPTEPPESTQSGAASPAPSTGPETGPTSTGPTSSPETTPTAPSAPTSSELRWAPPKLSSPTVVTVPDGQDPAILRLDTRRDYEVRLPPGGIHGTVEINGGHNVVLIGGEVTVPSTANQTDNGRDNTDTAIYVRAATGTVHIEGVLIRADPWTMFDGIDVNAPLATVQIENVRMEDLWGTNTLMHADAIQTWGGVKELNVDRLTANGDYQGINVSPALGPIGPVHLQNVDLTAEAVPGPLAAITRGGGIMLWLTRGVTSCESPTVTLQSVYIANLTGRLLASATAWPSPLSGLGCASVTSGGTLSWPGLPVSGGVTMGSPSEGPFVPEGVAGRSYASPGYQ